MPAQHSNTSYITTRHAYNAILELEVGAATGAAVQYEQGGSRFIITEAQRTRQRLLKILRVAGPKQDKFTEPLLSFLHEHLTPFVAHWSARAALIDGGLDSRASFGRAVDELREQSEQCVNTIRELVDIATHETGTLKDLMRTDPLLVHLGLVDGETQEAGTMPTIDPNLQDGRQEVRNPILDTLIENLVEVIQQSNGDESGSYGLLPVEVMVRGQWQQASDVEGLDTYRVFRRVDGAGGLEIRMLVEETLYGPGVHSGEIGTEALGWREWPSEASLMSVFSSAGFSWLRELQT